MPVCIMYAILISALNSRKISSIQSLQTLMKCMGTERSGYIV